ncbi:fuculose phosphate aldolase [Desulfolithobacter dissulfuricans]|uniref:Fuculose phosphate aldolase n=1 Tax=Desulfolithobacter dissulfuricans TaxID=2795293 RepID=A0A915U1T6_9BACT|nr:class II aldolase/adducin family protein [Desulfolithobacter dissulfuricans]BCO09549.1 fuculose phosphate aldolase [Desulfolithobacter dissulfuricans]
MAPLILRRQLIDTALAMNSVGLNQGTAGNLSVRTENGFLVTPSALPYDRCRPADMVEMSLAGAVEGRKGRPSSEWRLHRDIYLARAEAGAILHAHPPWCTTLACLERSIPPFHYMVAVAGGDSIELAPYATFGTQELSDHVLNALAGGRSACLLAHHGMVCYAADLEAVLALAIEVETLARMYGQALQIGEPPLLSREQMSEVLERFSGYRQTSS